MTRSSAEKAQPSDQPVAALGHVRFPVGMACVVIPHLSGRHQSSADSEPRRALNYGHLAITALGLPRVTASVAR